MFIDKIDPRNARDSAPVWPLPMHNRRLPEILDRGAKMPGVHLGYASALLGSLPRMLPIFAVANGEIVYAGKQSIGNSVIVDHCNGWATYYGGLAHMFATPRTQSKRRSIERVKAGDVLGYLDTKTIGTDALYLELWHHDASPHFSPIDVESHIHSWALLPWSDEASNANLALEAA